MAYSDFISQFQIINNPPKKKGLHRHHIFPKEIQKKLYGEVIDERQIYVTKAQHLWAHILYDQENNTRTMDRLLANSGLKKKDISCYEDCLPFNNVPENCANLGKHFSEEHRQKISESNKGKIHSVEARKKMSESHKNLHHSEETRKKMSESRRGEKSPMYGKPSRNHGTKWFNNGTKNIMALSCPEGYLPGRMKK